VGRYSSLVQQQGDSERDVLGFLPRSAYSEAAAQGKLYVATAEVAEGEYYAGHLLYGGRFPHLRVFQLYTLPQFRGRHIGRQLIDTLVSDAESQYHITISARVAADLAVNEFWERMGFKTIRTVAGGITRGRQINLRRRELDSPTLFSIPEMRRVTALPRHGRSERPIFALDVNVFLDVIKDRPRAEYAKRLLTASMSGMLRLFVAREFVDELTRAVRVQGPDPVVRLAMALPQFTGVPEPMMATLKGELGALIFPNRATTGNLRERDKSDLTHLATMIYHAASGFVTSDDSILGKRNDLHSQYGIEVLGPAELAEIYLPSQWTPAQIQAESFEGALIEVAELEEGRRVEAESFLQSCSIPVEQIAHASMSGQSACPRHRVVAAAAGEMIGFAAWDAARGPQSAAEAWLGMDLSNPVGELACDVLLDTMCRDVCQTRPASVSINCQHMGRETLEYAKGQGFEEGPPNNHPQTLRKYCIGRIIGPKNWSEIREQLSRSFQLNLPATPPHYSGPETTLTVGRGGDSSTILPPPNFESQFGPVILMLPARPAVVVPIRRQYADVLLNTADQQSLFAPPEASVLGERLYLSSPRALSTLTPGAVILFYESMRADCGRGAVVAAATVTRTAIKETTEIGTETTRRGVLSSEEVQTVSSTAITGLTFFSQLFRFKNPVGLSRLDELGCVDGAKFVTARSIDFSAASIIMDEGKPSV
jgi:GNAT superfamily N-acetyltransferase/predicted nucleic acid-binding protein